MNRFERHPVITLGAVVLALLLGVLLLTEALLSPEVGEEAVVGGDAVPSPQRFLQLREWQPLTRFSFGPTEMRIANDMGDLLQVYPLDTDQYGFIEPSVVHEKADVDIVFVGGSTTETMYVKPENRFPHAVGRLLEQRTGLKVNGINAGKSGNNAMHSLVAIIGKVLPKKPDYVVLMQNANDLRMLTYRGTYWNDDPEYALVRTRDRSLGALARDIRDLTFPYTYRRLRRAMQHIAGADLYTGSGTAMAAEPSASTLRDASILPTTKDNRVARAAADFENALRSVVAVLRAWHVEPVLMTQVSLTGLETQRKEGLQGAYLAENQLARGDFSPERYAAAHAHFNAIIRHVAQSEGATLIDLATAQEWTDAELYDGLHFLDAGSRKAAEIIATQLEPLLRKRFQRAARTD